MGLFDKMKEPVFLKESSDAETQLKKLKYLIPLLNKDGQTIIKQNIQYFEAGIASERTISFELKNSHMPLYILQDIHLDDGKLNAQIDYLVFSKKICFVIECKNLFGDIEITNAGDFIRTTDFGGKNKTEAIFSPIAQNQRHLALMKKIKMEQNQGKLAPLTLGNHFEMLNKSIVVLGSPKSALNAKFAKKEIKEKVIRADQLVKYIKVNNAKSEEVQNSDFQLLELAKSYLRLHKPVNKDYTAKYKQYLLPTA